MNIYKIIASDAAKKYAGVSGKKDKILLIENTAKNYGLFPSIMASRLFINKYAKSKKINSMFTYSNVYCNSADNTRED